MNTPAANATLSVAAILAESARRHTDRPAITFGGVSTSYGELWDQTRAYAGALRDAGIGEGDRVAVLIPNVTDFARVYYAVLSLGAVAVPIHALLKRHEIEYMLADAEVKTMVCAAPLLGEGAPGAQAAGAEVLTVLSPEAGGLPAPRGPGRGGNPDRDLPAAQPAGHRHHPLHLRHHRQAQGRPGHPPGAGGAGQRHPAQHPGHPRGRQDLRRPAALPHLRADRGAQRGPARRRRTAADAQVHRRGRPVHGDRRGRAHLRGRPHHVRRACWRPQSRAPRPPRNCATRSPAEPRCPWPCSRPSTPASARSSTRATG